MTGERAGTDRGAESGPEAKLVTGRLHRVQRGRRKRFESAPPPPPERRPARAAMQLALAHEVVRAIDRGELKDQADAARRLGLTRARLTQLLDLTLLAPDIQERVLLLEAVDRVEPMAERTMRQVEWAATWEDQMARFDSTQRAPRC